MKVWVLYILHEHAEGIDFYLFDSMEKAHIKAAAWAREWWIQEGMTGDPAGLSDKITIALYFDAVSERESYEIIEREVE
jgi:hypothetical protein